jgi:hypothetical protein
MSDTLDGSALANSSVTESKLATAFTSKVTNAYTSANNAYAKANAAVSGDGGTTSGNLTIGGNLTVNGTLVVAETFEQINVSADALGANLNFDIITQPILYLTGTSTANCTVNFRGNSTVSLESFLTTGNSVTATLLVTNTGVGYKANVVQVDGVLVTPKWAGAIVPATGNPYCVDLYTFTIVKTASLTYTVFASQQKYG